MRKTSRKGSLLLGATGMLVALMPGACGFAQATPTMPDWQKAAGGSQQFDVASVREEKGDGKSTSNFSLDSGNAYFVIDKNDKLNPNGTLFSAKESLMRYIIFAYKLGGTQELALRFNYYEGLKLNVPDWVQSGGDYDIEARAPGSATKDQMRLMMQSLLADRFKLAVHWETREAPVFALVLAAPGKPGPQLKPHPASDDCATTTLPDDKDKDAVTALSLSALSIPCDQIAHLPPSVSGAHRFGGRNVPLALLASSLPAQTGLMTLPRPVIDNTGLGGGYDFWMEWTPEDTSDVNNGETGGTFREALKNQLGLKLEAQKGPVEVLVIDHVEQPSAN